MSRRTRLGALAGLVMLLVAAWTFAQASGACAGEGITTEEYAGRLREGAAILERAAARGAALSEASVSQMRRLLPAEGLEVETGGGRTIAVRHDRFLKAVEEAGGRGALEELASSLRTGASEIAIPARRERPDRELLQSILTRETRARPPTLQEKLVRRLEAIGRWILDRLGGFTGLVGESGRHRIAFWVAVAILAAAGVASVAAAVRRFRREGARWRRSPGSGRKETPVSRRAGAEGHWRDAAAALAARGKRREALSVVYGALVERLVDAGLVEKQPGLTNREIARRAMGKLTPSMGRLLDELTAVFDRKWYGVSAVGLEEYEAFVEECDRLFTAVEAIA